MKLQGVLMVIAAGGVAYFVATRLAAGQVKKAVAVLNRSDVTADDLLFAHLVIASPFASEEAQTDALNLIAALDFQADLATPRVLDLSSKVTAKDLLLARVTLANPFASDDAKRRARALLDSVEQRGAYQ